MSRSPSSCGCNGEVLSFISTTMIFGTPVDVTLSELALETFFPADDLTAERMREMAASRLSPMHLAGQISAPTIAAEVM